jgi:hypothetical protein
MAEIVEGLKLLATLGFVYVTLDLMLKNKVQWITSIRSIVTVMIACTFCYLALLSRLETKDFMLIASMVFNFYFLVKERVSAEEDAKLRLLNNQQGGKK